MLALARLGDMDGAYRFADALYPSRRGQTPAEEERIWLDDPEPNLVAFLTAPAAAPLRRDARYIALAEGVGLAEYWRSGRAPDFCRPPQPEPICQSSSDAADATVATATHPQDFWLPRIYQLASQIWLRHNR